MRARAGDDLELQHLLRRLLAEQPHRPGDNVVYQGRRYTVHAVRPYHGENGHWDNKAHDRLTVVATDETVMPLSEVRPVFGLAQLANRYRQEQKGGL